METPSRALNNLHLGGVQKHITPIKIPASPFMANLGYGTCVNVYKLDRPPSQGNFLSPWAVKRVSKRKNSDVTEVFNERIQKEASILRHLRHPNIVGFRGLTKSPDGLKTLVLECCTASLGSILEEKFENESGPLPLKCTLKMITDISSALDYLHTKANILHGDMKSFNILVNGDFDICKICDFGVSLPLDENGLVNFKKCPKLRYVGTNLWSAPEIIDEVDVIDCKADIFSFGLTVYETIALVPPHTLNLNNVSDEESLHQNTDTSSVGRNEEIDAVYGTRPPFPDAFQMSEEYNQVIEIFYCCTSKSPAERPTAKAVLEAIDFPI